MVLNNGDHLVESAGNGVGDAGGVLKLMCQQACKTSIVKSDGAISLILIKFNGLSGKEDVNSWVIGTYLRS